jgi:hypothetical protein
MSIHKCKIKEVDKQFLPPLHEFFWNNRITFCFVLSWAPLDFGVSTIWSLRLCLASKHLAHHTIWLQVVGLFMLLVFCFFHFLWKWAFLYDLTWLSLLPLYSQSTSDQKVVDLSRIGPCTRFEV